MKLEEIQEFWNKDREIDYSDLEVINFSTNHLQQIYKQNIHSAEQVQESIYAFAHDLKETPKTYRKGPFNFFMGVLKRGNAYAASETYENPQDREMREFLEEQKKRKEKREQLRKETIEIAFQNWKEDNPEELQKIPLYKPENSGTLNEKIARSYFEEEVFPGMIQSFRN